MSNRFIPLGNNELIIKINNIPLCNNNEHSTILKKVTMKIIILYLNKLRKSFYFHISVMHSKGKYLIVNNLEFQFSN